MSDMFTLVGSDKKSSTPSANTETAQGICSIRDSSDVSKLTPEIKQSFYILTFLIFPIIDIDIDIRSSKNYTGCP